MNEDVLAWARSAGESALGGPVTIEVVKARRWASSWRLEGPSGVAYLKAGTAATGYEAGLMAALAAADPSRVPTVAGP